MHGQEYAVCREDGTVTVDGVPVDVSLEPVSDTEFSLILNGQSYTGHVCARDANQLTLMLNGETTVATFRSERDRLIKRYGTSEGAASTAGNLTAPMPGLVLDVLVEAGQEVAAGQGLVVLEAMKMENELCAATAGNVTAIYVKPGDAVARLAPLVDIGP